MMLPGEELVEKGIADLKAGLVTAEALLVAIGAPKLQQLGVVVPTPLPAEPEREDAHGRGSNGRCACDALKQQ